MSDTPRLDPNAGALGGQALVEGVMMRAPSAWAAAVRRTDGSIATTASALGTPGRWHRVPLVRGVIALVDSVRIGVTALLWSANERGEAPVSRRGAALSVAIAAVMALLVFGVAPAAFAHLTDPASSLAFSAVEGLVRLALLFGYLVLIGRSAEMRRTFGYHGAEHMTIHAHEHGEPLEVASIRRFDRRHPRCGTSFLVLTVLVTVVAFAFVGRPSWPVLILSRVIGIPILAGVAYEVIRFAGRHRHRWYGRLLSAPGTLVQNLTTREPDDDQILVAVAALQQVLAAATVAPGVRRATAAPGDGLAEVAGP